MLYIISYFEEKNHTIFGFWIETCKMTLINKSQMCLCNIVLAIFCQYLYIYILVIDRDSSDF